MVLYTPKEVQTASKTCRKWGGYTEEAVLPTRPFNSPVDPAAASQPQLTPTRRLQTRPRGHTVGRVRLQPGSASDRTQQAGETGTRLVPGCGSLDLGASCMQ